MQNIETDSPTKTLCLSNSQTVNPEKGKLGIIEFCPLTIITIYWNSDQVLFIKYIISQINWIK